MAVRCRDDNDAVGEKGLEEAAENHCVGDVRALELVEAEDAGCGGDVGGDEGDCVHVGPVGGFEGVQALVYVLHECVEVDSGLGGDVCWEGVVEHVHEHGLAGADLAEEVEALWRVFWDHGGSRWGRGAGEDRGEEGAGWGRRERVEGGVDDSGGLVAPEVVVELLEVHDDA